MADCFQPWDDNFKTCSSVLDGLRIPGVQTPENAESRVIICSKPECQKLFSVFRELIDAKCDRALREVKRFPNGMFELTYCPTTPAPGSGLTPTPSPSNKSATSTTTMPTATTKKPMPTPMPTTIALVPAINASSSGEETSVPARTKLLPIPEPSKGANATQAPLVERTTTPTLVQATSKSGTSPTTYAAVGVGGLAAIVVVILVVFAVRRKRRGKVDTTVSRRATNAFVQQQ